MGGRAAGLAVFAVLQRFISDRHLVLRGNPGPLMVWRSEKQRDDPRFGRCSSLFYGTNATIA
jgi:hypothetical protein